MIYQSNLLNKISTHEQLMPGLSDGSTTELCYKDILQHATNVSEWLLAHQVRSLAVLGDNSVAQIIIDLACLEARVVSVQIPPFFTAQQTAHAIEQSGCTHRVSDTPLSDNNQCLHIADRWMYMDQFSQATQVRVIPGTAKVTFTSGSTAQPKGLCLAEDHLMAPVQAIVGALENTPLQRHLCVLPQAVLLETVAGVYASLYAGVKCIVPSLTETSGSVDNGNGLIRLLNHHKISSAIVVPEILNNIVKSCEHSAARLPDLEFLAVGGSRVSMDLLNRARQLALPVYQGYGLSEAGSVVTMNAPGANKPDSVGKTLSHQNVLISASGEVLLSEPGFLGYCGTTPNADDVNGRFRTGDLGHLDDDGYLYIVGRIKNILITSTGRNVSPEWVETALLDQPGIKQAVVFGDAEKSLSALLVSGLENEQVECSVKAVNRALPDYAQIKAWYKAPAFTVANGHLTGNGKLKRQAILKAHSTNVGPAQ